MSAALPIGGTSGCCHESTSAIADAATWLASTPPRLWRTAIVPELRQRFGLITIESISAIREANLKRARAL